MNTQASACSFSRSPGKRTVRPAAPAADGPHTVGPATGSDGRAVPDVGTGGRHAFGPAIARRARRARVGRAALRRDSSRRCCDTCSEWSAPQRSGNNGSRSVSPALTVAARPADTPTAPGEYEHGPTSRTGGRRTARRVAGHRIRLSSYSRSRWRWLSRRLRGHRATPLARCFLSGRFTPRLVETVLEHMLWVV
jgi:hypothetical protein